MPAYEEIFEKVQATLVDALGVDEEDVTREATLQGDLGAESIDFLDIVFRLEKNFGIKIPRGELFPENVVSDPEMIAGGKLTTYREMAEDTVDAVLRYLYPDQRLVTWTRRSSTKRLTLAGGQGYVDPPPGSPDAHLARRYGSMAEEVRALIRAEPALGQPLVDGLPYLRAEAIYAVRHEQATTLDDVLSRRTRARLFDRRGAVLAAPAAAELLARELHWSHEDLTRNLEDFTSACAREDDAALAHSA